MEPVGPTLHSYADLLLHRGDAEAAGLRYREILEIGKAQGMRSSYAYCTGGLAAAARLLGDREAAAGCGVSWRPLPAVGSLGAIRGRVRSHPHL
jgi:hypothetical protein